MKKISLILSLIGVLLLVGCTDNKPLVRLSTPKNLVFSEDTLTFDAVDHATSYLVLADDFSVTTQTNSYTFTAAGAYRVRVIAKADGYLDSLFSSQIEVVIQTDPGDEIPIRLDAPTNLEDTLTFDAVDHATSYLVLADDFSVTTQTNSYTFTAAGAYRVRVIAKADGYLDSLFSSQIEVVIQTDPGDEIPIRLDAPTNLEFSENTLTFDAVEHATNYKIIGDNIDVVVTTNHYTF